MRPAEVHVEQTVGLAIGEEWFTPGVRGIGTASLLADLGHEVSTALLPSLLQRRWALLLAPSG